MARQLENLRGLERVVAEAGEAVNFARRIDQGTDRVSWVEEQTIGQRMVAVAVEEILRYSPEGAEVGNGCLWDCLGYRYFDWDQSVINSCCTAVVAVGLARDLGYQTSDYVPQSLALQLLASDGDDQGASCVT